MSLRAEGLSSALLDDCHLAVPDGGAAVLGGASGSGKTAFLRAVADLDPHEGEAWLGDRPRSEMSGPEWRRHVRYVAAEAAWWADTVIEHFVDPERSAAAGVVLGLPSDCMSWQVARLSSGEKQRLGLLRAIEDSPQVLLLDEPTASLDETAAHAVEDLIARLRSAGTAVVMVTHAEDQARRVADRRYVVESGRLLPRP